jgi:hypothetical protein
MEKQAGVETAIAVAATEPETPTAPQAGRISTLRRRGWRVSTPKQME